METEQFENIQHNAKVISFINMKGGVGKTTLTKEIGYHLSHYHSDNQQPKKVLLIDIDPQINLTQAMFKKYDFAQTTELAERIKEKEKEEKEENKSISKKIKISKKSISKIFQSASLMSVSVDDTIQSLDENLSIIPGELGIEFLTRNLNSGQIENGIYEFIRVNNLRSIYDFILIDCPPTFSSYTAAALKPSDYYIIPVNPEEYSTLGVNMLLEVVKSIVENNSLFFATKPLNNLGVIFTDIDKNPQKWVTNFIEDMINSKKFKESNLYFFKEKLIHNSYIKKDMSYFIDDSNSEINSKPNLQKIVDQIIERIENIETSNFSS
jgi:chromosome partitioning protein